MWFLAVWGRSEWLWLTFICVAVLYLSAWRYLWARRIPLLILISVGLLAEYMVIRAGVISFTGTEHLPMWLVLLWFGFAAMALVVFTWLHQRYLLALVAGIVFGPITYFAGVGLGAAELQSSALVAGITYSSMWALLMLLVVKLIATSADKEQRYV